MFVVIRGGKGIEIVLCHRRQITWIMSSNQIYSASAPIISPDGSGPLAVATGYADITSTLAGSAYQMAQTIGSSVEPLGCALQSLEQIVKVVDGIGDVSFFVLSHHVFNTDVFVRLTLIPICKATWTYHPFTR
jgi:hypothetical protein